jgi:hypothetical protein
MMWKLAYAAILGAVAACQNNSAEHSGQIPALMTIKALHVSQPGPGTAVGKFHILPSASGIETDGFGGGCLVFRDPASGVCQADNDCHVPAYIKTPDPYAYCADQQCWIKPSDRGQCWKSPYFTPPQLLTIGEPVSTPKADLTVLPSELFEAPGHNTVKARVIACLNGKFGPEGPPCATGTGPHIRAEGAVTTLSK